MGQVSVAHAQRAYLQGDRVSVVGEQDHQAISKPGALAVTAWATPVAGSELSEQAARQPRAYQTQRECGQGSPKEAETTLREVRLKASVGAGGVGCRQRFFVRLVDSCRQQRLGRRLKWPQKGGPDGTGSACDSAGP